MAHGSKKWITRYDGKVKRSNNRTKSDYYGELKWWEESPYHFRYVWRYEKERAATFCPQCKHVRKHIEAETAERRIIDDRIRREYITKYGNITEVNRRKPYQWWNESEEAYIERTGYDPTRVYFDTFRNNHPDYEYVIGWHHHWRSYLCFKCERKMELKDAMWSNDMHGKKANYQYAIRRNYQEYRSEVKTIMNKARQYEDFDEYEKIPRHRRNWYD